MYKKAARAVARALRAKIEIQWYGDFCMFFKIGWAGARFPRAQPRVHTYGGRQSILLIMELILHTLIAIVVLKEMKMYYFESWPNQTKNSENFEIFKIFEF